MSADSSYALSAAIPEKLRIGELTPIPVMKAIKNPVEIQGTNTLSHTCSNEIDPATSSVQVQFFPRASAKVTEIQQMLQEWYDESYLL